MFCYRGTCYRGPVLLFMKNGKGPTAKSDDDVDNFSISGLLLRKDPIAHVFLPFTVSEFPGHALDLGIAVLGIWILEAEKIDRAEKHALRYCFALPFFKSVFGKFRHARVGIRSRGFQ